MESSANSSVAISAQHFRLTHYASYSIQLFSPADSAPQFAENQQLPKSSAHQVAIS